MEANSPPCPVPKTVLFDLDNTLFDHYHSLKSALVAIQSQYPGLQTHNLDVLIDTCNTALEHAYQKYLDNKIIYRETDTEKVKTFFAKLQLPEPTPNEVDMFRAIYKSAYRNNGRATSGSIETLTRLRENGYRLLIVTNGQKEDQIAKAEAIGVATLADHIVTSEEVGYSKPDPRIFQAALSGVGSTPSATYMVGDSIESDIKGGLNAGLTVVLYSPTASDSTRFLFDTQVPVIRYLIRLLDQLHITAPKLTPACGSPAN